MTDNANLLNPEATGRITQLGSSNPEEVNAVYYPRELFVNTGSWEVAIHDGVTAGGHWLAKRDMSNVREADLMALISSIPLNKLSTPITSAVFISATGDDTNDGRHFLKPVKTFARALSLNRPAIICLDGSDLALSGTITGRYIYLPCSYATISSNTSLVNTALICRAVARMAGTLTIDNQSRLICNSLYEANGAAFISGTGDVETYVHYSGAYFTTSFTGSYHCHAFRQALFEPFDSLVVNEGSGVYVCNGDEIQIISAHNLLVAKMKQYLNGDQTTGVKTLTTAQTNGGTVLGDYFIYNGGNATTFKKPLLFSSINSGNIPNYDNRIYHNGSTLFTSDKSWAVNTTVVAYARIGGSSWDNLNYVITTPSGTVRDIRWQSGHGSGVSSSESITISLPANHKLHFTISGSVEEANVSVYSNVKSNSITYKRIRLY